MTATVYTGGRIFTAGAQPWADALVVDGDSVVFAGDAARATAAAGPDAATVDLGGRLLVPGFTDAHTHLVMMGEALGRVGLTDARTLGEIQERLRAAREARPDAVRVLGRGWLFDSVPGGIPTAAMIDAAVDDVPVYLDANDYHSCWVNTAALAELGITATPPIRSAAASGGMPAASPTACSTRRRHRRTRGRSSPSRPTTATATPPSSARSPRMRRPA
ncbi:amidohydrolase family protein [Microbacterium sp. LWS13-1.2]|uniref:amidohydrolase family protein n=1 Tax=Microbacterium sp. LWS13-1.2 TaxID=3135264 RepID=UPI0032DAFC03